MSDSQLCSPSLRKILCKGLNTSTHSTCRLERTWEKLWLKVPMIHVNKLEWTDRKLTNVKRENEDVVDGSHRACDDVVASARNDLGRHRDRRSYVHETVSTVSGCTKCFKTKHTYEWELGAILLSSCNPEPTKRWKTRLGKYRGGGPLRRLPTF